MLQQKNQKTLPGILKRTPSNSTSAASSSSQSNNHDDAQPSSSTSAAASTSSSQSNGHDNAQPESEPTTTATAAATNYVKLQTSQCTCIYSDIANVSCLSTLLHYFTGIRIRCGELSVRHIPTL